MTVLITIPIPKSISPNMVKSPLTIIYSSSSLKYSETLEPSCNIAPEAEHTRAIAFQVAILVSDINENISFTSLCCIYDITLIIIHQSSKISWYLFYY